MGKFSPTNHAVAVTFLTLLFRMYGELDWERKSLTPSARKKTIVQVYKTSNKKKIKYGQRNKDYVHVYSLYYGYVCNYLRKGER